MIAFARKDALNLHKEGCLGCDYMARAFYPSMMLTKTAQERSDFYAAHEFATSKDKVDFLTWLKRFLEDQHPILTPLAKRKLKSSVR